MLVENSVKVIDVTRCADNQNRRRTLNIMDESEDITSITAREVVDNDSSDSDDEKNTIKIHPITPVNGQRGVRRFSNKGHIDSPSTRHNNLIKELWPSTLSRHNSTHELLDESNVMLMNLQRKKAFTFAENMKLETEVEQLRAQLLLLENLEKKNMKDSNHDYDSKTINSSRLHNNDTESNNDAGVNNSNTKFHRGRLSRHYQQQQQQPISQHLVHESSDDDGGIDDDIYATAKKSDINNNNDNKINSVARYSGRRSHFKENNDNDTIDHNVIIDRSNNVNKGNNHAPSEVEFSDNYHMDEKRVRKRLSTQFTVTANTNTNVSSTHNINSVITSTPITPSNNVGNGMHRPRRRDRQFQQSISNPDPSVIPKTTTSITFGNDTNGSLLEESSYSADIIASASIVSPSPNINISAQHAKRPHFHRMINTGSSNTASTSDITSPSPKTSPRISSRVSPRSSLPGVRNNATNIDLNIEGANIISSSSNSNIRASSNMNTSQKSLNRINSTQDYMPPSSSSKTSITTPKKTAVPIMKNSPSLQLKLDTLSSNSTVINTTSTTNDGNSNKVIKSSSRDQLTLHDKKRSQSIPGLLFSSPRDAVTDNSDNIIHDKINTEHSNNLLNPTEPPKGTSRGARNSRHRIKINAASKKSISSPVLLESARDGKSNTARNNKEKSEYVPSSLTSPNPSHQSQNAHTHRSSPHTQDQDTSQDADLSLASSSFPSPGNDIDETGTTMDEDEASISNSTSGNSIATKGRVQDTLDIIAQAVATSQQVLTSRRNHTDNSIDKSVIGEDSSSIIINDNNHHHKENHHVTTTATTSKLSSLQLLHDQKLQNPQRSEVSPLPKHKYHRNSAAITSSISSPLKNNIINDNSHFDEESDCGIHDDHKNHHNNKSSVTFSSKSSGKLQTNHRHHHKNSTVTVTSPLRSNSKSNSNSSTLTSSNTLLSHDTLLNESLLMNSSLASGASINSARLGYSTARSGYKSMRNVNSSRVLTNPADDEDIRLGKWTHTLSNRWEEVKLLLRKPIINENDMHYTMAAAEAGLMFTDQLNDEAKSLNVLRGTLSRWLLPYDNNTRIDEQASTAASVLDSVPENLQGKLTERKIHYLVAGLNNVRKLVRIKIADDNDLEQARQALKTTVIFFKELNEVLIRYNNKMEHDASINETADEILQSSVVPTEKIVIEKLNMFQLIHKRL